MHLKRLVIIAFAAAGLAAGAMPGLAQGIAVIDRPSELPPASFTGRQFVDSRGCVFVRAGFDGAVIWVPRVTRDREQICGYAPTFGGTRAAAEPVPEPTRPAAKPKPIPKAERPLETVASRPASVVKAPASKPPSAPPPSTVVRQVPVAPSASAGVCPPGYSGNVERNGMAVRCGPQAEPYVTEVERTRTPARGSWDDSRLYADEPVAEVSRSDIPLVGVSAQTRIIPDQVYRGRSYVAPIVPPGYRPAWQDDRLNPYRAWQTVGGYYQTQRHWTNTVPRQNPSPSSSKFVRAKDPVLLSPSQVDREPPGSSQGSAPVLSTRSASKTFDAPRYVQIGVFASAERAQQAVSRLGASGLPVAYTDLPGGARRIVVGPFRDQAALQAGLRGAQAAGYVQASLR
ncbi:SPOR domain-containing protein [Citreicella sp. C3M06]|uniref:SPOR domain-containing protein n=1 Tax=Citreicella sp. C3M06 TaxID=2841564 RepID=UPI001C093232|nr:SPOR domain-containing protein [Citreicella sp. C3M06]MBU2960850.1 SPOR domain-containing protein [Citreicella sp. C3M06]